MEQDQTNPATEAIAETPVESAPTPEITETPPAVAESADDGPLDLSDDVGAEDEVEEPDKPKSRFQSRIDKLTADKYAAEREVHTLRERLHNMEGRERPVVDELDYDGQERQRMRDVLEEQRRTDAEDQIASSSERAHYARQQLFAEKVNAARAEIPNLDEGIRSFAQLPVTPEMAELIAESDKAAHIAHYMGRNPQMAETIAFMSPVHQGKAIAQIEAKVTLPSKKTSSAPAPVGTVAAQSSPGVKSPNEMTAAEYLAHWKTTDRGSR